MGGIEGRPIPGGAQTVTPPPTSRQLQPALTSVASVTPWGSAVSPPEETANDETAPAGGIALGLDGDAQAPIANPPNTIKKVQARLNTFDMLDLLQKAEFAVHAEFPRPRDPAGLCPVCSVFVVSVSLDIRTAHR